MFQICTTILHNAHAAFFATVSLGMRQSSNPNVVRFQQVFANLKSDGFSDSFKFGYNFHFGKPKFIIRRNLPLAIQK